jgi:hypothetical protein
LLLVTEASEKNEEWKTGKKFDANHVGEQYFFAKATALKKT